MVLLQFIKYWWLGHENNICDVWEIPKIVWEMHCFKRVFMEKVWEMHVNILILIVYVFNYQANIYFYENMRNDFVFLC